METDDVEELELIIVRSSEHEYLYGTVYSVHTHVCLWTLNVSLHRVDKRNQAIPVIRRASNGEIFF